jgi:hypothetical protein
MKNGRPYKSRDEIFVRGRSYNTFGVKLAFALAFPKNMHHLCFHDHKHMIMSLIKFIVVLCHALLLYV